MHIMMKRKRLQEAPIQVGTDFFPLSRFKVNYSPNLSKFRNFSPRQVVSKELVLASIVF